MSQPSMCGHRHRIQICVIVVQYLVVGVVLAAIVVDLPHTILISTIVSSLDNICPSSLGTSIILQLFLTQCFGIPRPSSILCPSRGQDTCCLLGKLSFLFCLWYFSCLSSWLLFTGRSLSFLLSLWRYPSSMLFNRHIVIPHMSSLYPSWHHTSSMVVCRSRHIVDLYWCTLTSIQFPVPSSSRTILSKMKGNY